jgi:putative ABC transporter-associated repeat protein
MPQISRSRAVAAAAVALVAGAPATAAAVTIDSGHADYGARIVGRQLVSQVKDQSRGSGTTRWRDPAGVVVRLRSSARVRLPREGSLSFVGRPGQAVWLIPQVQKAGVPWLGWNTQEITSRQVRGGVTWTLQRVSGPGRVVLYQTGSFGAHDVIFSSARSAPGSHGIPLGTHAHGNWAFTRAGRYRLTFRMTARSRSGRTLGDTATLAFRVG